MKYFLSFTFLAVLTIVQPALGAATVSGFADAQFQTANSASTNNSFSVQDGAVYLSGEAGSTKTMIDIPFVGGGATNAFTLGAGKAQAYVNHKYTNGVWWQMGQFDTIYGFEVNDSKDNYISRQGLIKSGLRTTHTGLMMGGNLTDQVSLKALVSNQNNTGARGIENLEFGGQLGYNSDQFHLSAGYLHFKGALSAVNTMQADFVLGTKLGDITADVEFAMTKPNLAGAETGIGVGGFFAYPMAEKTTFHLRAEYGSKYNSVYSTFSVAGGPSFKLSDNLTARAHYTFTSSKALSTSTSTSTHLAVVSSVFTL